ncbi:MAG TPA: Gfo/Idh/MocA family oxidoreductase [Candidatus Limnocylindrales bacterium]|nr:Gfo/Idh/MocA family oxidoreductase [Candidatus Limnocylindrales bacterium]
MSVHEPIRIAVIGCGRIAQTHLQACQEASMLELVAVCDINNVVAQSVKEAFGCRKAYDDYRKMLESEKLDAVIICTPPSSHVTIACDAIGYGLHVLCEKPFATRLEDALKMVAYAEKQDRLIMMASKFRFSEDVIKARGIIQSGILGNIILYENVFCSKVNMAGRWNAMREISGGGVLIDNGSHAVDIARFLVGPIVSVQTQHGIQVQPIEVEDTSRFYFQTESGVLGIIDLSWSIYKDSDTYIGVYGTEGTLSIGWQESKYRQSEKLNWVRFGKGYDKQKAFTRQLQHFVNCLLHHEIPIITPQDAVESVRVIDAAYESARFNKWLDIGNRNDSPGQNLQSLVLLPKIEVTNFNQLVGNT